MRVYCDRHQKILPKGKCEECQNRALGYGLLLMVVTIVPLMLLLMKVAAERAS